MFCTWFRIFCDVKVKKKERKRKPVLMKGFAFSAL